MIKKISDAFILETDHTSYIFRVMKSGHLEHLYYGRKITVKTREDIDCLLEKRAFAPGNSTVYSGKYKELSLEDCLLEMSSLGKGDTREPFIELRHMDGSTTCDLTCVAYAMEKGKKAFKELPGSFGNENEVETLDILLRDKNYGIELHLLYYVYDKCDVITRAAKLENKSDDKIYLDRLLSLQLDLDTSNMMLTTFTGAWAREMKKNTIPVLSGKYVNESNTGASSNQANPFCMLSRPGTNEDFGEVYGFNLIYSGNHYECLEVSSQQKLRFLTGINPRGFSFEILPGEDFEAPETVMTYSDKGFNGMSQNMHSFVREHIVRGAWAKKPRPILLNSWEAAYFDINEKKLLKLAKAGKDVGIELFVMDDGWFGERNDDTSSLGDWYPNKDKLPEGLKGLCDKVNELGLSFGIWVEPEMVNEKSNLYKEHPDWALRNLNTPHSEGRNQMVLDLTKEEVQDYVIESMTKVFGSANIEYVKWDYNRNFSDVFSTSLPSERQGEVYHRYMLGLYRCLRVLMKRFPDILFEGCASGGNRFDLGMLCFFPQIWASDNTDAICRAEIQTGLSYGYPISVISSHVSGAPNHQTLRTTPMNTRYAVASFGVLGYELNLSDSPAEELKEIETQIAAYKEWRDTYFFGSFYRGRSFTDPHNLGAFGTVLAAENENITEWTVVSPDKKQAVGMILQKLAIPNTRYQYFKARGLKPEARYHFTNIPMKHNIKAFGDLVNTASPVHIKQNSVAHNMLARFYKMDGETEDYAAFGDTLMNGGVKLSQGFAGTGYDDRVRFFPDFVSRLYYIEEMV